MNYKINILCLLALNVGNLSLDSTEAERQGMENERNKDTHSQTVEAAAEEVGNQRRG